MFERGVVVSYETIRRWWDKFSASFGHRTKGARHKPGSTWHLDVKASRDAESFDRYLARYAKPEQHKAYLDAIGGSRRAGLRATTRVAV